MDHFHRSGSECGAVDCYCSPVEGSKLIRGPGSGPRAPGLWSLNNDDPTPCCLVCGCDDCICPPDDDGMLITCPGIGPSGRAPKHELVQELYSVCMRSLTNCLLTKSEFTGRL